MHSRIADIPSPGHWDLSTDVGPSPCVATVDRKLRIPWQGKGIASILAARAALFFGEIQMTVYPFIVDLPNNNCDFPWLC